MQLYVGGLADDTTETELSKLFSRIGPVESATIIKDINSGKSRGFAVVKMISDAEMEEAIKQLNGATWGSRQIVVTRIPEILPGEMEFREWLRDNAFKVLQTVGIRARQAVVDYGCGSGIFTIPCAKIVGREGKVYALDVCSHALERVKEKAENEGLGNIETILIDSSKVTTGLSDESIDAILVYDVMHAIDDKQGLIEELYRVLRQDGFLSIFPMHMGTDKMLEIMNESQLFSLRDRYGPPAGHKTASEILNFNKC